MKSYAELLAACAEFQENFAALNGKYNGAVHELQNQKDANERLMKQLETMRSSEDKLHSTVRELKKELDEANTYRDRYLASTMSVEHLKGRLENARRAVADNMIEHEQQVEQLREQIKDLLHRINVSSDAQTTQQLKRQVVELEERCAQQSAQLLEEKERFSHQLLSAHTALREQQTRYLELEQRYRTAEAEVVQMRSVVRRSVDLQNDAVVAREKSLSEARKAVLHVESLESELRDTQARLSATSSQHTEEMEVLRAKAEEEKAELLDRISELSARLDDVTASQVAEQKRYAGLQRSVHQRIEVVRSDARVELMVLQKALADARSEGQQLTWRVDQTHMELEESKRLLQQKDGKLESCNADCMQLRKQVDGLQQREAWLTAESEHLAQQLAAARRQTQEVAMSQRAKEESGLEVERLRIQLRFLEDELQEARRGSEVAESRVKDVEEAAERRLRAVRHELKCVKKQARAEGAKADAVRRRLVQALLEREAEATAPLRPRDPVQQQQQPASTGLDVLTLLRGQTEQAAALHTRLIELAR